MDHESQSARYARERDRFLLGMIVLVLLGSVLLYTGLSSDVEPDSRERFILNGSLALMVAALTYIVFRLLNKRTKEAIERGD